MAMFNPIEGPSSTPPVVSLVRQAQVIDGGGRWEGGFTWQPRGCTDGNQGLQFCNAQSITFAEANDWVTGVPFTLASAEKCNTFGWQAIDYRQRVVDLFEDFEPKEIEREFWTGTIEPDGQHLASGSAVEDVSGVSPYSPVNAIAALEGYIADCGTGGRGMIHMTRRTVPLLSNQGIIIERNGGLYTHTGTVVIAGAGYPGTGPDGTAEDGTEWMFATSWVKVLRGEVQALPDNFSEALNRSINEVAWAAMRTIGIAFDPCCLGAVTVDMPIVSTITLKTSQINATSDGDNVVIAAVPGKKLKIADWELESTTTGIVTVKDSATNILRRYAGGTSSYSGSPVLQTATGEGLLINNQAGQDTAGVIHYREV